MDEHIKNLHGKSNFVCTKCDHEFSEEEGFNNHLKTHDKPKESSSSLQNAAPEVITIENEEDLYHVTNSDLEVFKCKICTFTFPGVLDLAAHIEMTHPNVTPQPNSLPAGEL